MAAMTDSVRLRVALERYRASKARSRVETEWHKATPAERMEYHFYRFVEGASDDLAIRGWQFVMDNRQRRQREALTPASEPDTKPVGA